MADLRLKSRSPDSTSYVGHDEDSIKKTTLYKLTKLTFLNMEPFLKAHAIEAIQMNSKAFYDTLVFERQVWSTECTMVDMWLLH